MLLFSSLGGCFMQNVGHIVPKICCILENQIESNKHFCHFTLNEKGNNKLQFGDLQI